MSRSFKIINNFLKILKRFAQSNASKNQEGAESTLENQQNVEILNTCSFNSRHLCLHCKCFNNNYLFKKLIKVK